MKICKNCYDLIENCTCNNQQIFNIDKSVYNDILDYNDKYNENYYPLTNFCVCCFEKTDECVCDKKEYNKIYEKYLSYHGELEEVCVETMLYKTIKELFDKGYRITFPNDYYILGEKPWYDSNLINVEFCMPYKFEIIPDEFYVDYEFNYSQEEDEENLCGQVRFLSIGKDNHIPNVKTTDIKSKYIKMVAVQEFIDWVNNLPQWNGEFSSVYVPKIEQSKTFSDRMMKFIERPTKNYWEIDLYNDWFLKEFNPPHNLSNEESDKYLSRMIFMVDNYDLITDDIINKYSNNILKYYNKYENIKIKEYDNEEDEFYCNILPTTATVSFLIKFYLNNYDELNKDKGFIETVESMLNDIMNFRSFRGYGRYQSQGLILNFDILTIGGIQHLLYINPDLMKRVINCYLATLNFFDFAYEVRNNKFISMYAVEIDKRIKNKVCFAAYMPDL